MENKKELGIYIHIPFCKQKCYYCDFISYSNKNCFVNDYIDAVCKEIEHFFIELKNKAEYKITTIYIGGGTPSYIDSKYIKNILYKIYEEAEKYNINIINPEITIEINPGTITEDKLKDYKEAKINRISIGLQSTNNDLLKEIGRIHNYDEFVNAYNLVRNTGFDNINVDLMLGLPNQTISDLKDSLEKVISLSPEHISVYSLIVEENTPICKMINEKVLELPDEELERNMYWYVKNQLELNGYTHYEISNFAKENKISRHNMNCWNQIEYVGFGVASHSYIDNIRFSNTKNIEEYIKNINDGQAEKNIEIHEEQSIEDAKKEYMLLSLRKIEGVSIQEFKNKFQENPIYCFRKELQKLTKEELIIIDGDRIKLTNKGLDLANIVWEEFV